MPETWAAAESIFARALPLLILLADVARLVEATLTLRGPIGSTLWVVLFQKLLKLIKVAPLRLKLVLHYRVKALKQSGETESLVFLITSIVQKHLQILNQTIPLCRHLN
jgi:hypothetical protein